MIELPNIKYLQNYVTVFFLPHLVLNFTKVSYDFSPIKFSTLLCSAPQTFVAARGFGGRFQPRFPGFLGATCSVESDTFPLFGGAQKLQRSTFSGDYRGNFQDSLAQLTCYRVNAVFIQGL